MQIQNFFF